ncbi:MAG: FAD/NAD(P)-binding protein [Desulfobulbaceae bacterium]|nr:FAD/NAD(P)-binding protein [Desulfobulbaceae bacterium]MDY0349693.1 FAD/NAD(P)-binding protein [Desulfobulbaceae bacterium]
MHRPFTPPPMHGGRELRPEEDPAAFEYSYLAEITNIYPLTSTEKLYQIQLCDSRLRRSFTFRPGQFVMLELPGIGEAPFSISSSPLRHGDIELCIRAVGNLTGFLDRVKRGTRVGISGPFGTWFPVEEMQGSDMYFIAGGLGIVPLRSPLCSILESRSRYGEVNLIYGANTPQKLLFTYQYDAWRRFDIDLQITVDEPDAGWDGHVGLITAILEKKLEGGRSLASNAYAVVCGPPVMFRYVCDILTEAGLPMQRMFVSLERRMHCGRGKCCRCNIGSTYTCLKGPVFDYWSVMNLKEAI